MTKFGSFKKLEMLFEKAMRAARGVGKKKRRRKPRKQTPAHGKHLARVRAAKKAARTRARNAGKRSRAAKKAARSRKRRR